MVFKLFKYLKDCKKDVFLGILFIFLESGLEIIVPFLSSILIDQGLITNQQEEIIGYNLEIIYIIAGVMVVCGVFERERFLMSITVTASWNGAVT